MTFGTRYRKERILKKKNTFLIKIYLWKKKFQLNLNTTMTNFIFPLLQNLIVSESTT